MGERAAKLTTDWLARSQAALNSTSLPCSVFQTIDQHYTLPPLPPLLISLKVDTTTSTGVISGMYNVVMCVSVCVSVCVGVGVCMYVCVCHLHKNTMKAKRQYGRHKSKLATQYILAAMRAAGGGRRPPSDIQGWPGDAAQGAHQGRVKAGMNTLGPSMPPTRGSSLPAPPNNV